MNAARAILFTLLAARTIVSARELSTDDTRVRLEFGPGQIRMNLGDDRASADLPLPEGALADGWPVECTWNLVSVVSDTNHITATFNSPQPGAMEIRSIWRAHRGRGPIEHELQIENQDQHPIALMLQPTLRFASTVPQNHVAVQWSVEKGAGIPTVEGVHDQWIMSGRSSRITSHSIAHDKPRDRMPWTCVHDPIARRGWYAGIESTANVQIEIERREQTLQATLGLAPDEQDSYRTRIMPGETLALPTCFVGCYDGDVDDGSNRLRHWVQEHLVPAPHDERYPLLVNNTWGSGMEIDEKLCRRMIDDSAALGLEMFHIDAGWYRAVGDWRPDAKKFPNGLAAIADYAHEKGLKFGLWVAWSHGGDQPAAADHSILTVRDPAQTDWFTSDRDQSWHAAPFTGAPLCLADPHAGEWCLKELKRIVREYKLDLLEHDQVMVLDACKRATHPHMDSPTDISHHAARGYYAVYDELRKEFPQLMLEDCVNGGNMIDYGVVRRVNYISITDTYDPLSNRRAFYDASYALPPAMCECYVQQMPVKSIGEFKHMLRSGMMGWCTIMLDTSQWTPEQHAIARQQFEIYKKVLRPLILQADLYHVSGRPDGVRWDGMEYFDPQSGRGALFAFRGTTEEDRHPFTLKGLNANAMYALKFQDTGGDDITMRGSELMSRGVEVRLNESGMSDLVYFHEKR